MKVSDIMTRRVVTVSSNASIVDAARLMLKNRISALPVIDAEGSLVGIVSEGDFLRRSEIGTERKPSRWFTALFGAGDAAKDYMHSHGMKVDEVMTSQLVTVGENASLDKVVQLMEAHDVKRLPVVRRGKIVGIVSRANLMRALVSLHRAAPKSSKGDVMVRKRIISEIEKQDWCAGAFVDVVVHKGTVVLWGRIRDVAQRKALKALAESIPGVKKVHEHLTWSAELMVQS
jgi:CBS domain-containing protein